MNFPFSFNHCRGIICLELFLNIESLTILVIGISFLLLSSSINYCSGVDIMSDSIISLKCKSLSISPVHEKLSSKNMTFCYSNSVTISFSCSSMNMYPFKVFAILIKIHFLLLVPNFTLFMRRIMNISCWPPRSQIVKIGVLVIP